MQGNSAHARWATGSVHLILGARFVNCSSMPSSFDSQTRRAGHGRLESGDERQASLETARDTETLTGLTLGRDISSSRGLAWHGIASLTYTCAQHSGLSLTSDQHCIYTASSDDQKERKLLGAMSAR